MASVIVGLAAPVHGTTSDAEWDVEILKVAPDPLVVTDENGRKRMLQSGLPWKVRDRKTGIVMLLCPAGEFVMGSPIGENGRSGDETPHRRVIGTAFYLSETEVTQGQWTHLMGTNPSFFKNGPQYPVESISWSDCEEFLRKAGGKLRLPSEAEWEYACRAGSTGSFSGKTDQVCWYAKNSGLRSRAVGSASPNGWGICDMHGNVWEWCTDGYAPYPQTGTEQPAPAVRGQHRVIRGGGWGHSAEVCRSAHRNYVTNLSRSNSHTGLRVARTASARDFPIQNAKPDRVVLGSDRFESMGWKVEVLAEDPEPAVVTDEKARMRIRETGLPWKIRDRNTGIVMLLVPIGSFTMGSPDDEPGHEPGEHSDRRSIRDAFYLSQCEVMQSEWQSVMGSNPSLFIGENRHPVEQVSWDDCQEFVAKSGSGLRLPTEAEWEYACRAGTTGPYAGELSALGWYGDNSGSARIDAAAILTNDELRYMEKLTANGCRTHETARKVPNPWGFYDMHGNVWEWCEDAFTDNPMRTDGATSPVEDAPARVMRGGAWTEIGTSCRSAKRGHGAPDLRMQFIGLRVARSVGAVDLKPIATEKPGSPPVARGLTWDAEILAREPDPSVVRDRAGLERMLDTGLPWKVRDKQTGIVMLLVPPGDFLMGSPAADVIAPEGEQQRPVRITKPFYISETEVTQEQWTRIERSNPSATNGLAYPVERVSWDACQDYCRRTGFRLPTEAEWEYACRAGTTGAHAGLLTNLGWYVENSGGRVQQVKQLQPNPWGFFDMHGNVWEWCGITDVGGESAAKPNSAAGPQLRPLRGGGWVSPQALCQSATRMTIAGADAYSSFGFRVARDAN